jgi:hypothetical protein
MRPPFRQEDAVDDEDVAYTLTHRKDIGLGPKRRFCSYAYLAECRKVLRDPYVVRKLYRPVFIGYECRKCKQLVGGTVHSTLTRLVCDCSKPCTVYIYPFSFGMRCAVAIGIDGTCVTDLFSWFVRDGGLVLFPISDIKG